MPELMGTFDALHSLYRGQLASATYSATDRKTLYRLISNAVESGTGPVLVYVRRDGEDTLFTTVNRDIHDELDVEWAQSPFRTDKPHHLGLGLALARRDLDLMGGSLDLTRTSRGETLVMARIPTAGADLG